MPSDVGRALSIQQQYALELIAEQAGITAGELLAVASRTPDIDETRLGRQYEALLAGALLATARTRAGYLQAFAQAEGVEPFTIPQKALSPTVQDVMALSSPSSQGPLWASLAHLQSAVEKGQPDALQQAVTMLQESTESTAAAAADWVDGQVLGPSRTVVAMRRVVHPGACDRCQRVAGVLVFKSNPSLRHPQCKCSFEPVLVNDPEYQGRLAKYRQQSETARPGAYFRDLRYRGRQGLEQSAFREQSVFYQESWRQFLKDEQVRLAQMVKTVPSNTYRDWALMVSVKATDVGGDMLPVITRN